MTELTGLNMNTVKHQNEAMILQYLITHGATSRKTIGKEVGLTSASVTQITRRLLEEQILIETGETVRHTAGRREISLELNPSYGCIITINIEPGTATVAVSDFVGNALAKESVETEKEPEPFLKKLVTTAKRLHKHKACSSLKVLGISVGTTGAIDKERGVSQSAYGIWNEEVEVVPILERLTGLPVTLENNVNAYASAEMLYGIGRIYKDFLLIKWGPGVGSTIIIDGRIYEGRHGKAAELGHYIAVPNGRECSCGKKGCLETIVSARALSDTVGKESAVNQFAIAIVNTITILAPNRVVLYGPLVEEYGELLISSCLTSDPSLSRERFVLSELTDRKDYIGPAADFIVKRFL